MLHLYCIVPAGHAIPPDCTGLEGRRPFSVEAGGLGVWASEHHEQLTASLDRLREHNELVTAAMDTRVTPIPLRFGQSSADRAAAADRITADAAKWLELLDRFAGHAEYGVRVLRQVTDAEQDVHAPPVESGTEYMATLARRQAQAAGRRAEGERIAAGIEARIGDLATETRVEYAASGEMRVTVAHLVAWRVAEAYHGAMREVREASQDTRFVLTGPWPPWSFVE